MRFGFRARNSGNGAAQDFADNRSRIAGTIHAKVSELIRRQTLRVQGAKTGFVPEEWAAGHGHAARKQDVDGGVEPNNRNAGVAKEFGRSRLGVRPSAERENSELFLLDSTPECGTKLIGFQPAKGQLAVTFKKFRNRDGRGRFDALV